MFFSGEARQPIALAMLFLSAPKASNDFTSRSTDTVGSPFIIYDESSPPRANDYLSDADYPIKTYL
jgi:hypothetical protein